MKEEHQNDINAQNLRKVPKLRFPEFEGEWERKRLKEIGSFISGGTPKTTKKDYYDGYISFIRSGEINSETTKLRISEEGLKNSSAKMVNKGEILIALYGATSGEIAISKIYGAINQAVLCVDTKENKQFFKNLWQKHIGLILKSYLQGGQGNLSAEIIKQLKFNFPSQNEQDKIALFLEHIEERIELSKKIIEKLESQSLCLVDKILKQQIRFKNGDGNEFPDWKAHRLGDIGETYNGLTNKTKEDFGIGKPYIQYKQIFDQSKIDITKCDLVNINYAENQNRVKKTDIFFTISSETPDEIGMASVLLNDIDEMYLNSFCFGYRQKSIDILSPYFARYLFRSTIFRKEIIKLAQGSTRYNLSKIELMKMIVHLPCLTEQAHIANFLSSLDEKIETEKKILEQCKNQKIYLLQNMFI